MSAVPSSAPSPATPPRHPLVTVLALLFIVLGLVLGGLGAWLLQLGGSAYYVLAGLALLASGILLFTNRRSGAWVYLLLLAATVIWTAVESGGDYWRWVPRLGLFTALGFVLAMLLPTLRNPVPRSVSRSLAGVIGVGFVAAFALAFIPHGLTRGSTAFPEAASSAGLAPTAEPSAQPANDPAAADWTAWGRSNAGTRYSPLHQITPDNVGQLTLAWQARTGDSPRQRWGAQTTPLKIGDSVYLCSARSQLIALDAGTGRERWRFNPKVRRLAIPQTATCRGVAYYEVPSAPQVDPLLADVAADLAVPTARAVERDSVAGTARRAPCTARIIAGTLDGRLIAVDAGSGRPCAQFGNNGQLDITLGMGEVAPGQVAVIAPPTIVRGLIITGHQVQGDAGADVPSGVIQAYDAQTGKLRWVWDMEAPGRSGLPPQGTPSSRGTPTLRGTATSDEQLGLVYVPLGQAAADDGTGARGGPREAYANALVALDVSTGKPAWHFQTVRDDVWGYELAAAPTLIDYPTAAGKVPALLLATRQGDLHVLDRRSGTLLSPAAPRAVPQGRGAPSTQLFSAYHTLRRASDLDERDMWGLTPIDQLICRIQFRAARYEGVYTPPETARHTIQYPGRIGGVGWGGVAVDTRHGVIVANYNDLPDYTRLRDRGDVDDQSWLAGGLVRSHATSGTPEVLRVNPGWRLPLTRLPCKQPPYGGLRAIDLRSGALLWDRPFGSARGTGPFGVRSGVPIEIGAPNSGGAVVTAGGLIFIAAADDNLLRAIDLKTGTERWHTALPAGGQATPMLYDYQGRQYLVIVATGQQSLGTERGDHVLAYALPKR